MARFTYRKKDANRYAKVYPYVRFPPKYVFEFDTFPGDSAVEAGKITFSDSSSETYSFTGTYASIPSVIIGSVDTGGNGLTNVGLTITAISTTQVTVSATSNFTGQVHIHVAAV